MKNKIFILSSFGLLLLFLSSCFLFRKTQQAELPPVVRETAPRKPAEQEENKNREEHETEKPAVEKKGYYEVALFAPLGIDGLFEDGFKLGEKQALPPETSGGLAFYEGAKMALDSLHQMGIPIKLHLFDTKSFRDPLQDVLKSDQLKNTDLIIGAVKGDDFKNLAAFSKEKEIRFLSATYPNSGGIEDNPYLIILNSTLRTHCFAIQDFAQKKFGKKKITVIYRDDEQGKRNLSYLEEAYNKMNYPGKAPLNVLEWNGNKEADQQNLLSPLDKDKVNVVILMTLFPDVSLNIIKELNELKEAYDIKIIGMPTLNSISELKSGEFKGLDFYYGTVFPYQDQNDDPILNKLIWDYFREYSARPGTSALSGYESLFYFGSLLGKEGKDFNIQAGGKPDETITSFDFQPVFNTDSKDPDYFENSRIYFYKLRDGEQQLAN